MSNSDKELIDEICQLTSEMYSLDYVLKQPKLWERPEPITQEMYDAESQFLFKKYGSMFDDLSAAEGLVERLAVIDEMKKVLDDMIHLRVRFRQDELKNVD